MINSEKGSDYLFCKTNKGLPKDYQILLGGDLQWNMMWSNFSNYVAEI